MNSRAAVVLQLLGLSVLVCCQRLSGRAHARTAEDQERTDGWSVQDQVISGREETAKDSRRQNAHGFLATQMLPISHGRGAQVFDRFKAELAKINQSLVNAKARRKDKARPSVHNLLLYHWSVWCLDRHTPSSPSSWTTRVNRKWCIFLFGICIDANKFILLSTDLV